METKTLSTAKLELASNMLKVIAHPIRIAMIEYLQLEEKTVTEIYSELGLEQAVASHHLSLLKTHHILKSHRVGKHTYYSLKFSKILDIIDCIEQCQPEEMYR